MVQQQQHHQRHYKLVEYESCLQLLKPRGGVATAVAAAAAAAVVAVAADGTSHMTRSATILGCHIRERQPLAIVLASLRGARPRCGLACTAPAPPAPAAAAAWAHSTHACHSWFDWSRANYHDYH